MEGVCDVCGIKETLENPVKTICAASNICSKCEWKKDRPLQRQTVLNLTDQKEENS